MRIKRALCGVTAACVLAASTMFAGGSASAADSRTNQQLHAAAVAAAAAADLAFIAGDIAAVRAEIAAYQDAYIELVVRYFATEGELAEKSGELDDARRALSEAEAAADAAQAAVDAAQEVYNEASARLDADVATALGAPSWWTDVVAEPMKISELTIAMQGAQGAFLAALERAYDELGVLELETALDLAGSALDHAVTALGEAQDAVAHARQVVVQLQAQQTALGRELQEIAALQATDAMASAAETIADRRADLNELDALEREVVWTFGADTGTPRAGDTIELDFSLPNTSRFDLTNAEASVLRPGGVLAACDVVGDVVASGATVHCTAHYVATEADALAGEIVFEVRLTGYIPLGPGNPRSQAVTQTLVTLTSTFTVPMAAVGGDGNLADTGFEPQHLVAVAAALIAVGAVFVVRRSPAPVAHRSRRV